MHKYDARPGSMNQAIAKLAGVPYQAILIAGTPEPQRWRCGAATRPGGKAARNLGTELWNTDSAIASRPVLNGSWFASVPDGV